MKALYEWIVTGAISKTIAMTDQREEITPVLSGRSWRCPLCSAELSWYTHRSSYDRVIRETKAKYCPECGRKVMWDNRRVKHYGESVLFDDHTGVQQRGVHPDGAGFNQGADVQGL